MIDGRIEKIDFQYILNSLMYIKVAITDTKSLINNILQNANPAELQAVGELLNQLKTNQNEFVKFLDGWEEFVKNTYQL